MNRNELYEYLSGMTRKERSVYVAQQLERLRRIGKVNVRHNRKCHWRHSKELSYYEDYSRGGSTEVTVDIAPGVSIGAKALCNPRENYVKHIGIAIAAHKLAETLPLGAIESLLGF